MAARADNSLTRRVGLGSVDIQQAEMQRSIRAMSRSLRHFANNELRVAMVKASKQAAEVAVPYVRAQTPVRTGALRANIKAAGTRTTPKIRAGTKTRGGPYAWFVHQGTSRFRGTPYLRVGIRRAYPKVLKKYVTGQRAAAKVFNASTQRRTAKLGRIKL